MNVLVIGLNGIGLMPTTPRKARILLKERKAEVVRKNPFTIKLLYKTGSATQQCLLGIDTGANTIGIAVVANGKVLLKEEVEMRSTMEKRKLLEKRKVLRRNRRYRKTPYRHPKFKHARKRVYDGKGWKTVKVGMESSRPEGWLPPSIQAKVDSHILWIKKHQQALPLNTVTTIEVARFDVQHMQNPEIHGEIYQQGRMYEFENKKAYVLAKFGYKCAVCGKKFSSENKARMHHVTYKSKGATDNPDEYAPVCEHCHTAENHQEGKVLSEMRKACSRKEYREPTFMNILRKRMYKAFPNALFTYGNITNADRKRRGLPKTHANDAIAIALRGRDEPVCDSKQVRYVKQVRVKKRSLHEANPRKGRKQPNRNAEREWKNVKEVRGFCRYDTVEVRATKEVGFISGFTGISAYIKTFDGKYIARKDKHSIAFPLSQLRIVQKRSNNYIAITI